MGKRNRPLVVRIRPGDSKDDALKRALDNPNASKRNTTKVLIRVEAK